MKKHLFLASIPLLMSTSFAEPMAVGAEQMRQPSQMGAQNMERKPRPGEVIPTVQEATFRLESLKKLTWVLQHRIATLQDWNKKTLFQNNAFIIIETLQKIYAKSGLKSRALANSPEARVDQWEQEGYINTANVIHQLNMGTCKAVIEQAIQSYKVRARGIKGLMWKNKKAAQTLIGQLEDACKQANNRLLLLQNNPQVLSNALKFNALYSELRALLNSGGKTK
ncbi:hypothetical protein [Candidatus Paracaedibacter symbiosus]|uniref:hypothetical protein n=1 Tax=Candidatus Paracaedibacter symbiosus TaxID=244582 RepID=UPI0005098C59|nr:hypothetical protein [Candidatus Paracaedibacter symbiosus]